MCQCLDWMWTWACACRGQEIWPRSGTSTAVPVSVRGGVWVCVCESPRGIMTLHHLLISQLSHLINTPSL